MANRQHFNVTFPAVVPWEEAEEKLNELLSDIEDVEIIFVEEFDENKESLDIG